MNGIEKAIALKKAKKIQEEREEIMMKMELKEQLGYFKKNGARKNC